MSEKISIYISLVKNDIAKHIAIILCFRAFNMCLSYIVLSISCVCINSVMLTGEDLGTRLHM